MVKKGKDILKNKIGPIKDSSGESSNNRGNEFHQTQDEIEIMQYSENVQIEESADSEEENFRNLRFKRKRTNVLSDSENVKKFRSPQSATIFHDTEIALDGTIWKKLPEDIPGGRPPINTIFKDIGGPTGFAKRNIIADKVSSAFHLLITRSMVKHIICCTEAEARRVLKTEWSLPTSKFLDFIGLLYARGAYKASTMRASFLWSKKWGPAFFANTMTRDEFMQILRFLRFDKKTERSQRLPTDKFALISEVWNDFINNSQTCFKLYKNITIDEQLLATKSRCKFTQYMPNKPQKFGIKFWLAVDVKSKYVINGFPYLGKDESRNSTPLGEFVVLKLAEPYLEKGRNITTDNFFTSIPLAKKLAAKRTTLVGTIRANKRELPRPAKSKKDNMILYSSEHYKSENCILTIYKSKHNVKVLLLSTKHRYVRLEDNNKRTPATIRYYNKTKFGVDIVDQMVRKYTVKAASNRWPLQVFGNILDLAALNSWILYKECTGSNISRKDFIFQLSEELAGKKENEIEENIDLQEPHTSAKRQTCQVGFCKRNRSKYTCRNCKKIVCGKCTHNIEYVCKKCAQ